MTEPESNELSSEVHSDIEKSTNEFVSAQGSVSDVFSEKDSADKLKVMTKIKKIKAI